MKRLISELLFFVMLVSLCACGEDSALSKDYSTKEELATALMENYSGDNEEEFLRQIEENTQIHHYFSEEESDNRIWEILYDSDTENHLSLSTIYSIYAVCNGSSRWFDVLNINGKPFAAYGSGSPYYSGVLASEEIVEKIKGNFKDPYSVSIEGDMFLYPEELEDEESSVFSSPLNCLLMVNVRATNSFGAYLTQGYLLKINGGLCSIVTECEYSDLFGCTITTWDCFDGYQQNGVRVLEW